MCELRIQRERCLAILQPKNLEDFVDPNLPICVNLTFSAWIS